MNALTSAVEKATIATNRTEKKRDRKATNPFLVLKSYVTNIANKKATQTMWLHRNDEKLISLVPKLLEVTPVIVYSDIYVKHDANLLNKLQRIGFVKIDEQVMTEIGMKRNRIESFPYCSFDTYWYKPNNIIILVVDEGLYEAVELAASISGDLVKDDYRGETAFKIILYKLLEQKHYDFEVNKLLKKSIQEAKI